MYMCMYIAYMCVPLSEAQMLALLFDCTVVVFVVVGALWISSALLSTHDKKCVNLYYARRKQRS